VLARWLTSRCWTEDVPTLTTAAQAVHKHLREQNEQSSSTQPFTAANRADVFTYHYAKGRGVRWHERPRELLWLCGFDDAHDPGYEHCEHLQAEGSLYPALDPEWKPGENTLLPWEAHVDEDIYEWARMIHGALETWEINRAQLEAGESVSYGSSLVLTLSKDKDDIWTMIIRKRLAYLPPAARPRERYLENEEIAALFAHLAGHPSADDYVWDQPPHPQAFMFARVEFFDGPVSPADWLKRICDDATSGTRPALVA
jgi:hypothetical protein